MRLVSHIVACWMALSGSWPAGVLIDLPEISLLPNTTNQSLDVLVENSGDPLRVTGIGFNLQVADGGPAAGGLILGPAITSVDLMSGTIFASNNIGLSGSGSIVPQIYERGTLTASGSVSLPSGRSKLATIILDTTGFSSGTYVLTLNTLNGPTKYTTLGSDYFPVLVEGSLTVGLHPVLTGVTKHNPSRVALTFSTAAGFQYRVQCAQQLFPPVWTNIRHALTTADPLVFESQKGKGAPQTVFVDVPPIARLFYRISMERGDP
jgi:hypothetical protein